MSSLSRKRTRPVALVLPATLALLAGKDVQLALTRANPVPA